MIKAFFYLVRGFFGIGRNKYLTLSVKFFLYIDFFHLLFLAVKNTIFPTTFNLEKNKIFYSRAFKYTIHYSIFHSFYFVFNEIFCSGEYPPINNLKNYIDLGANIGLTILWYHYFNPSMITYAYEPDIANFKHLKKNIEEAGIKNCYLINKAVSNRIGEFTFYRLLDKVQNLDSSLTLNRDLPHETFIVNTTKISTLIKKIGKISLIKMDIEGGEYDVLDDIFTTKIENKIEKIFFESHTHDNKTQRSFIHVSKLLKKTGLMTTHPNSGVTSMNYWKNKNTI
jgi:FkbM family methyltransferase